MFSGCTSLTTVENLPNALLENKKNEKMFSYCSSLRLVKIGYKGNFTTDYFYNWIEEATKPETPSEDYVFYYNGTDTTRGKSTISSNWTIRQF